MTERHRTTRSYGGEAARRAALRRLDLFATRFPWSAHGIARRL